MMQKKTREEEALKQENAELRQLAEAMLTRSEEVLQRMAADDDRRQTGKEQDLQECRLCGRVTKPEEIENRKCVGGCLPQKVAIVQTLQTVL